MLTTSKTFLLLCERNFLQKKHERKQNLSQLYHRMSIFLPTNTAQSNQEVLTDLSTGTKTKTALIEFTFNGFPGKMYIPHPIFLKELILTPKMHAVGSLTIEICPEQVWHAFNDAGFVTKFGFLNKLQVVNWAKCKYKIDMNVDIAQEQNMAHIGTYY